MPNVLNAPTFGIVKRLPPTFDLNLFSLFHVTPYKYINWGLEHEDDCTFSAFSSHQHGKRR